MPSGNGSFDWVPKEAGLTKTASNNDGEVKEEQNYKDDLFEAAKKVVANMHCADGDEFGGDEFGDDDDNVEFKGDIGEVNEVSDDDDDDEAVFEVGEDGAVECLERAQEAIGEAVECLGGGNDEFEAEVDLEIEDEDVEVEGGADCCSEDKGGCCDKCNCDPCCCDGRSCGDDDDSEGGVVESGVEAYSDNWVKLAEISPKNRKKIYDYWSKQLGYPKDFVKLMVKDYEK